MRSMGIGPGLLWVFKQRTQHQPNLLVGFLKFCINFKAHSRELGHVQSHAMHGVQKAYSTVQAASGVAVTTAFVLCPKYLGMLQVCCICLHLDSNPRYGHTGVRRLPIIVDSNMHGYIMSKSCQSHIQILNKVLCGLIVRHEGSDKEFSPIEAAISAWQRNILRPPGLSSSGSLKNTFFSSSPRDAKNFP
ncbi:hypothetical protein VNO77_08869 [Canavalia gladiata]|uniref:Uncharacterized protein n=1 Tax=Canavalia gladiata TaxID=3824 RepID=A0AAN9ME70_CANGL